MNGAKLKPSKRRAVWRWFFRVTVAAMLAVSLGYLPYRIYGPGGVMRAVDLEGDLDKLNRRNAQLLKENREIRLFVQRLKTDVRAVERVARDELGLVRPDEVVYLFE